jgi:hypothetical protein
MSYHTSFPEWRISDQLTPEIKADVLECVKANLAIRLCAFALLGDADRLIWWLSKRLAAVRDRACLLMEIQEAINEAEPEHKDNVAEISMYVLDHYIPPVSSALN